MKKLIKRIINQMGYHVVKINKGKKYNDSMMKLSYLGEEDIIQKHLNTLTLDNKICVDIAASDGVTMSNTFFLYKQGWSGLAVEYDSDKFAILSNIYKDFSNVILMKNRVTPENVNYILKSCFNVKNFAFLNLDIDSYDYFILDQVLSEFRPSLICAEINEKVPPPIKFTVKYYTDHVYYGDHFYGQSISQLYELCKKYNYALVELFYNNAFLIPNEIHKGISLLPEEAFNLGYKNKMDRKEKFPWNEDMENLLTMSPTEGMIFINNKFEKYKNRFQCSL